MDRENNRALKRIYLSGILSGIFLCLILIMILQFFHVIPGWRSSDLVDDVREHADVIEKYVDKYFWKDDMPEDRMAEYAAKGMVSALGDKYSTYYSEQEYNETMNGVNGDYCGIGATLRQDNKTGRKYIESVQEGQSAQRAGLKAGDELLRVDGKDITGQSLTEIVDMIKGEEGKTSVLSIRRKEDGETVQKDITVVCEKIITQSVNSRMLEDKQGYIRITEFDKETVSQFKAALDSLEKQGQVSLIIDVRDNGGGSLEACIDMLDRLLPAGRLITERSKAAGDREYSSTDEEHFDKPVVVLINAGSASASEVFAGALQDRSAASLVGVKSFGKGIVQTIFSLENSCGGGIKLTTGEYFLPSGRSIHEVGLTPDVEEEYTGTTKELGAADDNQLKRAQEILRAQTER